MRLQYSKWQSIDVVIKEVSVIQPIETQLNRMSDACARMEEIHTKLLNAVHDLSDSCERLNLTWESRTNQEFMMAVRNDYLEMLRVMTYVWDAAQSLKFANGCYQIAEQRIGEEVEAI